MLFHLVLEIGGGTHENIPFDFGSFRLYAFDKKTFNLSPTSLVVRSIGSCLVYLLLGCLIHKLCIENY